MSLTFSKNLYTNFNPQIIINQYSHVSHVEFEKLSGVPVQGMGISGMMTSRIWGFKEHNSGLFY